MNTEQIIEKWEANQRRIFEAELAVRLAKVREALEIVGEDITAGAGRVTRKHTTHHPRGQVRDRILSVLPADSWMTAQEVRDAVLDLWPDHKNPMTITISLSSPRHVGKYWERRLLDLGQEHRGSKTTKYEYRRIVPAQEDM